MQVIIILAQMEMIPKVLNELNFMFSLDYLDALNFNC